MWLQRTVGRGSVRHRFVCECVLSPHALDVRSDAFRYVFWTHQPGSQRKGMHGVCSMLQEGFEGLASEGHGKRNQRETGKNEPGYRAHRGYGGLVHLGVASARKDVIFF
ncbi:unnamed protein product [Ectocarpus sp. 12 AP-2014]